MATGEINIYAIYIYTDYNKTKQEAIYIASDATRFFGVYILGWNRETK